VYGVLIVLRIPLIKDLTTDPLPSPINLLAEFDPTSQWYSACTSIAAGWLKQGGQVSYTVWSEPTDRVRASLRRLGCNVDELERRKDEVGMEILRIFDNYSATLGRPSKDRLYETSLKIHDLSISTLRDGTGWAAPINPSRLRLADNYSVLARFNEEKPFVEYTLTRAFPMIHSVHNTFIGGIMKGVHSDWVYKQFEGAADGVVDFKLDETPQGETVQLMRIRSIRNCSFVKGWHRLKLTENSEVILEK
jgi:hypothetical protein